MSGRASSQTYGAIPILCEPGTLYTFLRDPYNWKGGSTCTINILDRHYHHYLNRWWTGNEDYIVCITKEEFANEVNSYIEVEPILKDKL